MTWSTWPEIRFRANPEHKAAFATYLKSINKKPWEWFRDWAEANLIVADKEDDGKPRVVDPEADFKASRERDTDDDGDRRYV